MGFHNTLSVKCTKIHVITSSFHISHILDDMNNPNSTKKLFNTLNKFSFYCRTKREIFNSTTKLFEEIEFKTSIMQCYKTSTNRKLKYRKFSAFYSTLTM